MATSDQLLTSIRSRAGWPSDNAPLSDSELLSLADEEITAGIWPMLLDAQGDFYLTYQDTAITGAVSRYRLPKRHWGPIKDVLYVDSQGNESQLRLINAAELGMATYTSLICYVEGDFLRLYPVPTNTIGTLRIRYYRAPSRLIQMSGARPILGFGYPSTIESNGSVGGTDIAADSYVDFINSGNTHQVLLEDVLVSSITPLGDGNSSVSVGTDLTDSGLEPDDWITPAGTTPVLQIPDHLMPLLASRVAILALSSIGDQAGFQRSALLSSELESKAKTSLDPRVESEPKVILPRGSILRSGRWGC